MPDRPVSMLTLYLRKRQRKQKRPKLPIAAEREYLGVLRQFADEFENTVREVLFDTDFREVVKTDGFFESRVKPLLSNVYLVMSQKAQRLGETIGTVGKKVGTFAKRDVARVIGLKSERITTTHAVDAWRRQNVDLITRMTSEQLDQVADVLDRFSGRNAFDVADELQKTFSFTRSRAELIARDQILKLNASITQDAHRQAGIEEYIWSTSKDSSVRDSHEKLDGRRFRYDDPPVVDERTGRTANPGEDYQCRCVAIPVLPELEEPVPEESPVDDRAGDSPDTKEASSVLTFDDLPSVTWKGNDSIAESVEAKARRMSDRLRDSILTTDELEAFRAYSNGADYDIIAADRGKEATETGRRYAGLIDQALTRAPKLKATVYRGIAVNKETLDRIVVQDEYTLQSVTSTSPDASVSRVFAETSVTPDKPYGVIFEIENASGVPIDTVSNATVSERESLLKKGTKVRVKSVVRTKLQNWRGSFDAVIVRGTQIGK